MDYCLGAGDGSASMWSADPDTDLDGDGRLDAVGLDFDGDGRLDDAMALLGECGGEDRSLASKASTASAASLERRSSSCPTAAAKACDSTLAARGAAWGSGGSA